MPRTAASIFPTARANAGHTPGAATAAIAGLAVLAAAGLACSPPARAQADAAAPPPGFSGQIGLGLATQATYAGSDRQRALVVPELALRYRSRHAGTLALDARGLSWQAVEAGGFRLGLVAQLDLGRLDHQPGALNPTPGDDRLAGMGRVRARTEAGVALGYGPLSLVARHALGGGDGEGDERGGTQADLGIAWPWALSERLVLTGGLTATWADRLHLQRHFGVTQAQAQATGRHAFAPASGCRQVELSLGAQAVLSGAWRLQAQLAVTQLGEAVAASPLVLRREAASAAVVLVHAF